MCFTFYKLSKFILIFYFFSLFSHFLRFGILWDSLLTELKTKKAALVWKPSLNIMKENEYFFALCGQNLFYYCFIYFYCSRKWCDAYCYVTFHRLHQGVLPGWEADWLSASCAKTTERDGRLSAAASTRIRKQQQRTRDTRENDVAGNKPDSFIINYLSLKGQCYKLLSSIISLITDANDVTFISAITSSFYSYFFLHFIYQDLTQI